MQRNIYAVMTSGRTTRASKHDDSLNNSVQEFTHTHTQWVAQAAGPSLSFALSIPSAKPRACQLLGLMNTEGPLHILWTSPPWNSLSSGGHIPPKFCGITAASDAMTKKLRSTQV